MNDVPLQNLIRLLNVEEIEKCVYRGQCEDLGFKSLFGGQVMGQALMAAGKTVESDRPAHSLHGYFIRPGNSQDPLYFEVDLIRTGRSFSTRRVVAKQNGLAIFSMSASFQHPEEGLDHQAPMPLAQGPEGLLNEQERAIQLQDKLPEKTRAVYTRDRPIEVREVNFLDPINPVPAPALRQTWLKTSGTLNDDQLLHKALLAYSSDFGLVGTSLMPHGLSLFRGDVQLASLDHAMWFHRDFRFDDWLLYAKQSTTTHGARGFNQGQFFARDGTLVASVTQEGLIRKLKKPQK